MPNFKKATTDRGPVYGVDGANVFINQADDIMARAIPVLDNATDAAQAAGATFLPDALAPRTVPRPRSRGGRSGRTDRCGPP